MNSPLLIVNELNVTYGDNLHAAVSNVSFEVARAASMAIVGESGSGKSTLALSLIRLLGPNAKLSADTIVFDGTNIMSATKSQLRKIRRDQIGTVFQDPFSSWNPSRTVGTQLLDAFPKSSHESVRETLIDYMEVVGIDRAASRLDDYPYRFSGGLLQRAMIAGALLGNPSLLIADEPTSALDVTVQAELLNLLDDLQHERGLALLLISHNIAVVSKISEKTMVMYAGELVEESSTIDLLTHPKHPYTVNLLSSTPTMSQKRKIPLFAISNKGPSDQGCVYSSKCSIAIAQCKIEKPPLIILGSTRVACHRSNEVDTLMEHNYDPIT